MSQDWPSLRSVTQARIGLMRSGNAQATGELLSFQLAHAQARAAVLRPWYPLNLCRELEKFTNGKSQITLLQSQAKSRQDHLLRPDDGRKLDSLSKDELSQYAHAQPIRFAFCVTDGLSAPAIDHHFLKFWQVFAPNFEKQYGPVDLISLIPFGRVALSDEIGETLQAELSIIFVGERPGLSSPDSMGIYLTYQPKIGKLDSARNCISNVRPPDGLGYGDAAQKLLYLIGESIDLRLSGIHLKDQYETIPKLPR